ncbi:hypothetical protein V6Z12_D06G159300 [Gossypium hirsutum]
MGVNTDKENEIFMFGKTSSPIGQQLRANTIGQQQRGKPPDEILETQEQQSVDLQLTIEVLVCDIERNTNKYVMVSDPQVVEKRAGHPRFYNFVKEYRVEFLPDLFCLLEPQVSGARADGIIAKIGYLNSFKVEANGFAGGIWLYWDEDVVHVKIRSTMSSDHFFCSIHFLNSLAVSMEGPWMLADDFNYILDRGERKGGASISRVGCKWFREFLSDNGLQDLGSSGAKLDRVICNSEWDSFSLECSVRNLHRLKSDHKPILISLKRSVSKGLRPFSRLASWMSHVDFGNIVNSSWNNKLGVGDNLERF